MNTKTLSLFLVWALLLASCSSKRQVVTTKRPQPNIKKEVPTKPAPPTKPVVETPASVPELGNPEVISYKDKVQRYVVTYANIAQREMKRYGIPASITLAQGILESGAGEGELTRKANNHFGIKCHGWKGGKVYHDDDKAQECFRKYKDPQYSFEDHSLFLSGRDRYSKLFDLKKDDYKGWARGLRTAGYATDRKYPDKLISIIERYKLYTYDAAVLETPKKEVTKVVKRVQEDNASDLYEVAQGDTLYSIARRFKLSVEELKRYNGLEDNNIQLGQKLYIVPVTSEF